LGIPDFGLGEGRASNEERDKKSGKRTQIQVKDEVAEIKRSMAGLKRESKTQIKNLESEVKRQEEEIKRLRQELEKRVFPGRRRNIPRNKNQ